MKTIIECIGYEEANALCASLRGNTTHNCWVLVDSSGRDTSGYFVCIETRDMGV